MNQENLEATGGHESTKKDYIAAYFADARQRANFLRDLHANGRAPEALTLCLVYSDSFSQRLFWPRSRTGQNFVDALVHYGGDPDFGLIHPLAVTRAFEVMKDDWKSFAARLHYLFPAPTYSLHARGDFSKVIAAAFTPQEVKLLEVEL